jgi:hypothetical protein
MEHPGNRRNGIPVASGCRDAVEPVQRTVIEAPTSIPTTRPSGTLLVIPISSDAEHLGGPANAGCLGQMTAISEIGSRRLPTPTCRSETFAGRPDPFGGGLVF